MSVAAEKNLRELRSFWILCIEDPLRMTWVDESLLRGIEVSGERHGR